MNDEMIKFIKLSLSIKYSLFVANSSNVQMYYPPWLVYIMFAAIHTDTRLKIGTASLIDLPFIP